ncbi:hypothetical protein [Bibersteinia trehalosi]|uniref:hypothetical protein n=1 Tax=Bibersteinia trehalosi TaxID=47735 RepID=UPI004045627D
MIFTKSIDEMLSKIESFQPYFYGFESVVYSALNLLSKRENYDLENLIYQLDSQILIFQEKQIDESIDLAKREINTNPELYSKFFNDIIDDDPFIDPNLECIFSYFKMPNYETDWIEKYEILEQLLSKVDLASLEFSLFQSTPKDYELMAILALEYVNNALYFYDNDTQEKIFENTDYLQSRYTLNSYLITAKERGTREIISAFISIDKAKELKNNNFINKLEETTEKKY